MDKHIEALIGKAAGAANASEAMQFAQAAMNAAKAWRELIDAKALNR